MGLIFNKIAAYQYCTHCNTIYTKKLLPGQMDSIFNIVWISNNGKGKIKRQHEVKEGSFDLCPKCNNMLSVLNNISIYYQLNFTKIQISANSLIAIFLIKIPNIIFALVGILAAIVYLIFGFSGSIEAFRSAYYDVYTSLSIKIFGKDIYELIFLFLSIYFVYRVIQYFYYTVITIKSSRKNRQ